MFSLYFLSFNLTFVRFNHNLVQDCDWLLFMDLFPSNVCCDLSGLHRMVQPSPIFVVVNDTSDDSISV
jgi:hypothetical protein